jgi:hypothetical protein
VRERSTLRQRLLAAGDAFEDRHARLLKLVARDVHEHRRGHAVLRDQDRLLVAREIVQQLGGLALQCRHEFGSHAGVTL